MREVEDGSGLLVNVGGVGLLVENVLGEGMFLLEAVVLVCVTVC
jgi:hypothetical protein